MDVTNTTNLVDNWHLHSVGFIQYLQSRFQSYEWWIVQASVFGDNRQAFAFFFPLFTALVNIVGAKILWAAILTEWSNLILKWLFKGERPYWWVYETTLFTDSVRPMLRQFPNTCETGPGTPSGHITMNVAIFYVILRGLLKYCTWSSQRNWLLKVLSSLLLFALYAGWIALVFISRLYIQAHFIHQCTAGVLCGLLIGHFAWKSKTLMQMKHLGSYLCAIFLFITSSAIYMGLQHLGINPLWSVPLARKYCIQSDYVRVDTQAFHGIIRFTASALGLGYGLSSKYRKGSANRPKGYLPTVLAMICGGMLGKVLLYTLEKLPTDDWMMYYSAVFGLHLVFPYVIIAILPYLLGNFHSKRS